MQTIFQPELLIQAFYLTASAAVLIAYLSPALKLRFLAYGARITAERAPPKGKMSGSLALPQEASVTSGVLDKIAEIKVPHNWFLHFYLVSVASSLFWAHQLCTGGLVYKFFERHAADQNDPGNCAQVVSCWALLFFQGLRRLYECLRQPQGSSKMWIGHYAIGIAFYLATGIAIWIEGLPALKAFHALEQRERYQVRFSWPLKSSPALLDQLAAIAFWAASLDQHILHRHLASLKKYTLPTNSFFQWIIAPHYTCECLIYLSTAYLSRPAGCYLNRTMATALIFVIINLGVSADMTKQWMTSKFGNEKVDGKWRMIPPVW